MPSMAGQECLLHTIMCVVDFQGGNLWVSIQWQCQGHRVGGWKIHCRLSDRCLMGVGPMVCHLY